MKLNTFWSVIYLAAYFVAGGLVFGVVTFKLLCISLALYLGCHVLQYLSRS